MRFQLAGVLLFAGTRLLAQQAPEPVRATLTVSVLDSASRQPLEGARIVLRSLRNPDVNSSRFVDVDGRVRFTYLDSGAYAVQIRRLGYAPRDTVLRIAPTAGSVALTSVMRQLQYTLPDVVVRARGDRCVVPGLLPPGTHSDLAAVLAAAGENAQREVTLRMRYPYTYFLVRRSEYVMTRSRIRTGVHQDTLVYRGNVTAPYRVGHVVEVDSTAGDPEHPQRTFRIPTLVDLADSTFLSTHCFEVAGQRGRGRNAVAVVRFRPLDRILKPDVEGEVELDAATLLLRRAQFTLTNTQTLASDLDDYTVTTTYRTLAPGLAIMDEIEAVQTLPRQAGRPITQYQESQRLSGLHFIGSTVPGYAARKEDEEGAAAMGLVLLRRVQPPPKRDTLATLVGTIADEHGKPLERAAVWIGPSLDSARARTTTDSAGRFRLTGLDTGATTIGVRRLGSRPSQFRVTLPRGDSLTVAVRISTLVLALPEVVVDAPSSPLDAVGFADRKFRYSRATFRDPDDLRRRPPTQLVDLLAGTMGVTIGRVNAYGGGTIPMGHGPGGTSCPMAVFVDRQFVNTTRTGPGGRTVPMPIEDVVNVFDIRAVEIYPDGPDVPPEFQAPGLKSSCGALVIWTDLTVE